MSLSTPLVPPLAPRVERSLLERIAYWDWDLTVFWEYPRDLVIYYWQTHGVASIIVIAIVAIALLMSWSVTRNATAKLVETVSRTTIRTTIYASTFIFIFGGRWLAGRLVTYGRWLWRTTVDLLR